MNHLLSINWKRPLLGLFALAVGLSFAIAQEAAPQKQAPQNPQKPAPQDPMQPAPGDPGALPVQPQSVEPGRAVSEVMTFTKELITEEEASTLGKELDRADKYKTMFRNAKLDDSTKPIIAKWAKWQMYRMTVEANRRKLHELRNELMQDIFNAGRGNGLTPKDVMEFRYVMCDEVAKRAAELLDNNFYVRLNATIVLAQLNLMEDDFATRDILEEKAYAKGAIPLLDVLSAPTGGGMKEQLEAVKVQAAIGLGRINLLAPPGDLNINVQNQNLRNVVAKVLIDQLQAPGSHEWYQKRLIDALGCIDLVNDVSTGKPIIVQALGEVLADRERHFSVRARAARALGRCHLPPAINLQKLVYQILLLEHEMALAYQKSPNEYYWLDSFQDVYFAFHPIADSESQMYGSKRLPGLNQKNLGTLIQEAYQQVLPIASHVINQPGWIPPKEDEEWAKNAPIPSQLIADLGKWLNDHQPADHKLAPNLPELAPGSQVLPAAGTATGG